MSVARALLARIQHLVPETFARSLPYDASTRTIDLAQLPDLLPAEGSLRVNLDGQTIELARSAQALAPTGSAGEGPLVGKVAIVSGAASGLGKGIAMGLYRAGACVLFTDLNGEGLATLLAELDDPARTHSAVVNVTDEASVIAGFDAALERFGRLDLVACAAGIAPPFELVDFPVDRWRLALEINLTGYFLFAREGARIMKAQGHGGSMVFLSSKSGLEPSKANTAYNATKAGELHMARGWALELGRDGIRCNCIAPGNVFEGSQIWNPDYIRTAAKKKGIKPEEVIPHYNAMTALNAEIKPEDIANAAVFLCSEQSRRMTGQVLVVDAGQVWTR